MHGLVSLLPPPYYQEVEALWKELEEQHGLHGIHVTPYAHFSWQIAQNYDFDLLEERIKKIARHTAPLTVRTTGIGLFTGVRPVIFIQVVKDAALQQLHAQIWQAALATAEGLSVYYEPNHWMPHISLAYEDITPQNIGNVMQSLTFREFNWEMKIDNIALIYEPEGQTGTLKINLQFQKDLPA